MKTIIDGTRPGTVEAVELVIEPVFPMVGEACVDVRVGETVARVSRRAGRG